MSKKVIKVKLGEPVDDSAILIKMEKEKEPLVHGDRHFSETVARFKDVDYFYFEVPYADQTGK